MYRTHTPISDNEAYNMLIHHTFAPHVDRSYAWETLKIFCTPWNWRRGAKTHALEEVLSNLLDGEAFTFGSGREALLAVLRSMNLTTGDEVIVPAYTCIAVTNAIRATGATVVLADIDPETLGADLGTIKDQCTDQTKAVLQQHTFGIPAEMKELRTFCAQHGYLLIEDCAHTIPDQKELLGDVILLSFGRDKAISGIAGGAAVSRNISLTSNLHQINKQPLSAFTIFRLLTYPLIYLLARPIYNPCGKIVLWLLRKLHWMVPVLTSREKSGSVPESLHTIPNACARLALSQLQKLHHINNHRRSLTAYYLASCNEHGWQYPASITEDLPLQKFPILIDNPDKVRMQLKSKNIHLSDGWESCIICPTHCDPGIAVDNYPEATNLSSQLLTLPTHLTMSLKQAKKLVTLLHELTS